MKKSLLTHLILAASITGFCQKAQDVIENGEKVKNTEKIFLKFDGTKLLYQSAMQYDVLNLKTIEDSLILLPTDASLNFFIKPLNPLMYSTKTKIIEIDDPIDQAASDALSKITSLIPEPAHAVGHASDPCSKWINSYHELISRVNVKRTDTAISIFGDLKGLDFEQEQATLEGLITANNKIKNLESESIDIEPRIKRLRDSLDMIPCADGNTFEGAASKLSLTNGLSDIENKWQKQKSLIISVRKMYSLVKSVQETASKNIWQIKLDEVKVPRSKISIYTVTLNTSGYNITSDNQIVPTEEKEKITKVFRVRRFKWFVPEVSAGMAYTNLSFPKYSTLADEDGVQHVANGGDDNVSRINFTVMLNYNFFISNSPLHPFWQLGIGANKEMPTLLSGIGFRVNTSAVNRLAISIGAATTWTKTLDKLSIGDAVKGQADIDNDVVYKFNDKPKLYLGIQFNF